MATLKQIEKEIQEIQARNKRVEGDKAWETSVMRRMLIATALYLITLYFLIITQTPDPMLNALLPPLGFIISTMTLPIIKHQWVEIVFKHQKKKEEREKY